MYELLWAGLIGLFQLQYLLPLVIGTVAGVVGGALPGVTITMTVIIVLPFTFGLDPLQGLAAMTGVYVGGSAGGLVTATLLGIPGTPSSVATTFDAFPMARKGEAGRALWLGVWGSFLGGLIGGVFL
ncbi:MAG: tripartite tricarboxylate transporter permease, partial [Geminicoccales bacterium]